MKAQHHQPIVDTTKIINTTKLLNNKEILYILHHVQGKYKDSIYRESDSNERIAANIVF